MPRLKVLLTVVTYPLPSRNYDELVCTAGILEDGTWVRIYPVPLSFLRGQRGAGKMSSFKYTWIELNLSKRTDDFRPESHSPINYNFKDLVIKNRVGTRRNWSERKMYCLKNVYTNLTKLIEDSKNPKNVSLATFKPSRIIDFVVEDDSREWKNEWKELRKQQDLFSDGDTSPENMIPKVPYKFYYKFKDDSGRESKLMIEDWEIGALYWNCLENSKDETVALEKVRAKFFDEL